MPNGIAKGAAPFNPVGTAATPSPTGGFGQPGGFGQTFGGGQFGQFGGVSFGGQPPRQAQFPTAEQIQSFTTMFNPQQHRSPMARQAPALQTPTPIPGVMQPMTAVAELNRQFQQPFDIGQPTGIQQQLVPENLQGVNIPFTMTAPEFLQEFQSFLQAPAQQAGEFGPVPSPQQQFEMMTPEQQQQTMNFFAAQQAGRLDTPAIQGAVNEINRQMAARQGGAVPEGVQTGPSEQELRARREAQIRGQAQADQAERLRARTFQDVFGSQPELMRFLTNLPGGTSAGQFLQGVPVGIQQVDAAGGGSGTRG